MLISSILDLVQINDLEVRCPSSHADCPWIGRLSSEESHLATCDYATVQCEHEGRGCAFRGERRSVYFANLVLSDLSQFPLRSFDGLPACPRRLFARARRMLRDSSKGRHCISPLLVLLQTRIVPKRLWINSLVPRSRLPPLHCVSE